MNHHLPETNQRAVSHFPDFPLVERNHVTQSGSPIGQKRGLQSFYPLTDPFGYLLLSISMSLFSFSDVCTTINLPTGICNKYQFMHIRDAKNKDKYWTKMEKKES